MSKKMPSKLISNTKRVMIKKTNASKLNQANYEYAWRTKADHHASKIPPYRFSVDWTVFYWKVLPNNKYLVRRIGINRTQVIQQKRLLQFTSHQTIPDTKITPREWTPNPEVIIKHDDLYDRAWECDYEMSIFDSDYNKLVTPIHPTSQYDLRKQLMEWVPLQEPYNRVPWKFSPRQTDLVKERIRISTSSVMWIRE